MLLAALCIVYTCQKSYNFINAFACYKQKCKLVPFNLAHAVDIAAVQKYCRNVQVSA